MNEEQEYSGRKLLRAIFAIITKDGKQIMLSESPKAEVNRDYRNNETRLGFMSYGTACLAKFRNKEYAIGLGERFGRNYLTESFDCDLCAIPFFSKFKSEERIAKEAAHALRENNYFKNSLMYVNGEGDIAFSRKSEYFIKINETLEHLKLAEGIKENSWPRIFTSEAAEYLAHVIHVVLCS